ncbi:hypothetical protein [Microbacterium algeriense]|uniref:hypothetical protein n=1 Tax=Microbacterium algeriense TaxID=2615184 RepID=UPI003D70BDD8
MSAERINHVGWANGFIADALAPFDPNEIYGDVRETATPLENLAFAQVHATLALVEQQRIANLIALAGLPKVDGFENEVYDASTEALMEGLLDLEEVPAVPGYGPAGIDQRVFIRPAIREALGLP